MLTRLATSDGATTVLDVVSVASLLGAVAVVAVVALIRLERIKGLVAVGLLVVTNASTLVLKSYLLDRPDFGLREVSPSTLNSLPSGHSTAVFSAVAALLLVLPVQWRYPAALAGLGMGTVTALATMSAGWHRAGDSMAAFLLVGVWTAIAAGVVLVVDGGGTDRKPYEWPASARWLATICAATLALGLTLGVALNALSGIRDATFGTLLAFAVGGLLIIGTCIGVLGGTLYVLGLMDQRSTRERQPRT